jgi:hypothetical protein
VEHYEVTKYNIERPVKFFVMLVVVVKVENPNIYSWLFHSCRSFGETILFNYRLQSLEHALLRLPVQRLAETDMNSWRYDSSKTRIHLDTVAKKVCLADYTTLALDLVTLIYLII